MSPPRPGERVPDVTFSYFDSRNRRSQYELVVREFEESGISRSELATRTGKSPAQISRLLGQPSNMTSDTMSELLFAIRGRVIKYEAIDPFVAKAPSEEVKRPHVTPSLSKSAHESSNSEQKIVALPIMPRETVAPTGTLPISEPRIYVAATVAA